jgi:mannose-1-phosphate guanylyltransferase / mannose-6-phosphate isomerase
MKIVPVILSGGSGTRLWPLSRKQHPKQYLPLVGKNTMLQETILRLNGLKGVANPIIVCNIEHRFLVAEQCQQINIENPTILLEPIGRNTAPAIAAAALHVLKNKDEILLVLSADHVIQNIDAFHQAIKIANVQAQKNRLVTFGIVPNDANTEYGYIKFSKTKNSNAYTVKEFVEKPNLKTAESYIVKGNYLWNSGMFMFKAGVLIDELNVQEPDVVNMVKCAVYNAEKDLDFVRLDKKAFSALPSDSIDYALMENSDNVMVVPLDAGWSDVGAWSALYDIGDKDNNGNVIKGNVIVQGTRNSYINANHRMVVTIGVHDLVIVSTSDTTFVARKDKAHKIKAIVEKSQVSD